jgi:Raf kinase inhibitor-like YbhB/YbcL family protein
VAACSGGGGSTVGPTLATARSAASTGPSSQPSAAQSPATVSTSPEATPMSSAPFTLTSSAFQEGGLIPRRNSCDGEDVSPPLAWSGGPPAAQAFAVVVTDPDARDFVHWIALDLPAVESGSLVEGASTAGTAGIQGRNSFGRVGWGGPCPPSGTHHYVFRLVALREATGLTGAPAADAALAKIDDLAIGEARLTGTYKRG